VKWGGELIISRIFSSYPRFILFNFFVYFVLQRQNILFAKERMRWQRVLQSRQLKLPLTAALALAILCNMTQIERIVGV
jgi:hypothetical protein